MGTDPKEAAASVYRFGDCVALHMPGAPTTYLSWKEAGELARAVNRVKRNIATCKFTDSNVGTEVVTIKRPFSRAKKEEEEK